MDVLQKNTQGRAARLLLLATLAATVAACSGDDTTGAPASTTTSAGATTSAAADQEWQQIVPAGDCQCSDGSEFSFWVREANPKKVVFYLQEGGACFSAETCAPKRDLYNRTVNEGPIDEGGIFDFADARNPFADYSVVYVPYCTGDQHVGNKITKYAPGLTVRHKGYANGTTALDHLAAAFPDATEVVVIGDSAGSVAAPLYAGLVSDRLPDARITVLAEGSGAFPDVPRVNELFAAWGTGDAIPAWRENAGLTPEEWSPQAFYIQSGRHDPEIVFARLDHAYDEEQESWMPFLNIRAKDLLSLIDANETRIERAGVNLLSYTAQGVEHVVLNDGPFYTVTVNGEKLVDWVTRLIEGEAVDDVHCRECRVG